jgi:hypothetical protein
MHNISARAEIFLSIRDGIVIRSSVSRLWAKFPEKLHVSNTPVKGLKKKADNFFIAEPIFVVEPFSLWNRKGSAARDKNGEEWESKDAR